MSAYKFVYCMDHPLLDVTNHPLAMGNINGPSLIESPLWIVEPLARYYLYFAHHEGRSIRLATADELTGPWSIYPPGALQLHETPFCHEDLPREAMLAEVVEAIDRGEEGNYAHIASPDVHVDKSQQRIRMYYHGRSDDGTQVTRVALSNDGLNFDTLPEPLGLSYFRVFEFGGWFYAIALGGWLYRSADGLGGFERGPKLTPEQFRHCAVDVVGDHVVTVFWSRVGDNPESILQSTLDTRGDWQHWKLTGTTLLHAPERSWEGSHCSAVASRYGGIMTAARQLRDPAVLIHDEQRYLLYSIAGEQGIALGRLDDPADKEEIRSK